jgi:hypothetical protein
LNINIEKVEEIKNTWSFWSIEDDLTVVGEVAAATVEGGRGRGRESVSVRLQKNEKKNEKMKVRGEGPGLMREIGLSPIMANSGSLHLRWWCE